MASKPPDEDFIGSTQDVVQWPGERNQVGCFRLPCVASTNARASKGFASKIELGVPRVSRPPWWPLAPACRNCLSGSTERQRYPHSYRSFPDGSRDKVCARKDSAVNLQCITRERSPAGNVQLLQPW